METSDNKIVLMILAVLLNAVLYPLIWEWVKLVAPLPAKSEPSTLSMPSTTSSAQERPAVPSENKGGVYSPLISHILRLDQVTSPVLRQLLFISVSGVLALWVIVILVQGIVQTGSIFGGLINWMSADVPAFLWFFVFPFAAPLAYIAVAFKGGLFGTAFYFMLLFWPFQAIARLAQGDELPPFPRFWSANPDWDDYRTSRVI